jgi:hypothetical protein
MEDEESTHRDAHFQEELESLKASVARLTSFLKQTSRNAFSEGPSKRPTTFVQNQAATQPKEITGERAQDPNIIQHLWNR